MQQQVTQRLEPLITRLTASEQEILNVRTTYRYRCQHIDEEQDSIRNSIEDLEEELKELRRRAERPHSEEPPRSRRRRERSEGEEDSASYVPSIQPRDEPEPMERLIRDQARKSDEGLMRRRQSPAMIVTVKKNYQNHQRTEE